MRRISTALAALMAAGCGETEDLPRLVLGCTSPPVRVLATRVARRDALAAHGDAEPYAPILLAYPRERIHHLHSGGLRRSFDAIFISLSGLVVEHRVLPRNSQEGITSEKPAAHVLLLEEGGWAASGAKIGQSVTLPPLGTVQDLWRLEVKDKGAIHVEPALTGAEWQRGLMFRARMSPDDGMIFKYPDERSHGFWMRNTLLPLDLAFFDKDGVIVKIHAGMVPGQEEPRYESGAAVQYALEVNAGWFARHTIGVGDTLLLPKDVLDARAEY